MQTLRTALRSAHLSPTLKRVPLASCRALSTSLDSPATPTPPPKPWFVDADTEPIYHHRQSPPHLPAAASPLPAAVSEPIRILHAQLMQSPHLEPSALLVRDPIPTPPGPPLPDAVPKGKRKRGGTHAGHGVAFQGGIWSWIVLAQVKEGTEKRGAIESVVRLVRKTLLTMDPPLPLPKNSRRTVSDGWAMVDAGDFAVHIVSRDAYQKFFTDRHRW